MKKNLVFLFLLILSLPVVAQKKHTLSGYIKDAATGETLIGATIIEKGNAKGISSNQYGFYSLTLAEGSYAFLASSVGYQPLPFNLELLKDTVVNISLNSGMALSEEVIVTSRQREECTNG